jgi:hypothetical protein
VIERNDINTLKVVATFPSQSEASDSLVSSKQTEAILAAQKLAVCAGAAKFQKILNKKISS